LRHCFGEAVFDGHKIQKNFVIGKPQLKGEIASGRQVYKQKIERTQIKYHSKKDKKIFISFIFEQRKNIAFIKICYIIQQSSIVKKNKETVQLYA
jgi:hypothetical protein